jgi:hypothetical protein
MSDYEIHSPLGFGLRLVFVTMSCVGNLAS